MSESTAFYTSCSSFIAVILLDLPLYLCHRSLVQRWLNCFVLWEQSYTLPTPPLKGNHWSITALGQKPTLTCRNWSSLFYTTDPNVVIFTRTQDFSTWPKLLFNRNAGKTLGSRQWTEIWNRLHQSYWMFPAFPVCLSVDFCFPGGEGQHLPHPLCFSGVNRSKSHSLLPMLSLHPDTSQWFG